MFIGPLRSRLHVFAPACATRAAGGVATMVSKRIARDSPLAIEIVPGRSPGVTVMAKDSYWYVY